MCGEDGADSEVCLDGCSGYEAFIDEDEFAYRYYTVRESVAGRSPVACSVAPPPERLLVAENLPLSCAPRRGSPLDRERIIISFFVFLITSTVCVYR